MKTLALLGAVVACLFASGLVESGTIKARLSLNFNSILDNLIATIHTNAAAIGLNPYNIQDINDTFKFGLIKGGLYLDNGKIYGFNTIFRNGNTTADLGSGSATVTVALGFKDLKYKIDFAAKVGILGPKGKVHGDITNLYVNAVLLANLKNTSDVTITLQKLKLSDKGIVTVHFDNKDPVAQDLLDIITDTITKIFKNVIIHEVEKEVDKAMNSTLSKAHFDINSLIG